MKAWISIAAVAGLALLAGLGSLVFRGLGGDGGAAVALQLSGEEARRGLQVATELGCTACHTLDGRPGIGPTWLGMYGETRRFKDGDSRVVDADYIRESIFEPGARVVEGYDNLMLSYPIPEQDLRALIEFTRQLGQDRNVNE